MALDADRVALLLMSYAAPMKLTPPSTATFAAGVILLLIGALLHVGVLNLPSIAPYTFWITFAGGVVLAAGAALRGA